jgi:glycosyltransferase involved in cell wall biosynthesis
VCGRRVGVASARSKTPERRFLEMIPEVSVIIPTYNRRAMVSEAIASVMAQTGASGEGFCEVIVVDDGSTDGTTETLDRIAVEADAQSAVRIRVVHTENRGVAAARNTGGAIASAPMLAFLDSDDLWLPHKLERQLAYMRAHPEYAIAQTEEIWMRGGRRVNPGRRHRKRCGNIFLDSLRTCLISPSAVILRTALLRRLGGFDEQMKAAEDYDLWLRILARYEVGLLAEPLVMRRAGYRKTFGAGNAGQLSATVPAIDRFRIFALLKLIAGNEVDPLQRRAVGEVLAEKCAIYAQGLRRRGRTADARTVAEISSLAASSLKEPRRASLHDSIASMLAIITVEISDALHEGSGVNGDSCGVPQQTSGVTRNAGARTLRETVA